MYLQEIVEVAIGLIFAWLVLSLAVLQIQEIIARITKKKRSVARLHSCRLKQAKRILEREMDLKRFITRQRMHTTAILGLLTGH